MQKNIRRIVGTLAFWAVVFIVWWGVNDVLRIKVGESTDMIHSFYEMEENTLDVLCVGSSHSYHSIQPNLLWGNYGIPSYVLSSPGQSVPCSYYLLKEALKYQSPKVVLLETYLFREENKYRTQERLRQAIDGIRFGETKVELIEDFFPDYSWKEKLSYYVPFLMYHNRWNDLKSEDFNQDTWLKGGTVDFKQVPQKAPDLPEKPRKIPEVTKEYLEKIIELCEEKGIPLVLYASPIGDYGDAKMVLRVNLSVEKFAAKRGIPFLFYQKTGELNIDYETDFYDNHHLNTYGSEKLTNKMGEWLLQNYDLADHRQEEEYASWDKDYERYKARCEKLAPSKDKE